MTFEPPLPPTTEQIEFLTRFQKPIPATRRQANEMMTKIIEEARKARALEAAKASVLRGEDPASVAAAFISRHGVRPGTILRDRSGPFVVDRFISNEAIKIFRQGTIITSTDFVVNDEVRGWIVRDDLVFEAQAPEGKIFSRCVRADDSDKTKRLQAYIKGAIESCFVQQSAYGPYWDETAVAVLTAEFVALPRRGFSLPES